MIKIPLTRLLLTSILLVLNISYAQTRGGYLIFVDVKVSTAVKNLGNAKKLHTEIYDPVGYLMSGTKPGANYSIKNVQIIPRKNQKFSVRITTNGKRYGPVRANCKPVKTTKKTKNLAFNVMVTINKKQPEHSNVKCTVKAS